jgi:putative FmdB family regulatory protein
MIMPIHIYKCFNCGIHFDKLQSYHDEDLKRCRDCGGELKKQISAPAIHFRGSGFYVNDNRSGEK